MFGVRYAASTSNWTFTVNGSNIGSATSVPLANQSLSTSSVLTQQFGNFQNMDLSALYIWDSYVPDVQWNTMQTYLQGGNSGFTKGIGGSLSAGTLNVSGTTTLSNVNISGILSVSNVEYITSNITIYNSEVINSNLTVLNIITSSTLSNTGNMYSSTFSNLSGLSTSSIVSTTLSNTGGLSTGALAVASNISFSNSTGTSTIYSVGANLGVGKSNPAYTLDVIGNINFTGALTSNGVAFSGGGSSPWSNWNCNVFVGASSNVGIGMSNPGYTLQVGGTIYASGDITAFSDARYKTNIVQISNSLDTVCRMNGYYYNRTDYESVNQDKDKKHIGFLAQEVMEVVPEIVEHDVVNDHYSVKYGNTVALLVEAIKEMRKEMNDLKSMIISK